MLSPSDNLLHVCGQAWYSAQRFSLRWVGDAWFIIERHRNLDWDLLLDTARRSHLVEPLSVMLGYLAEDLGANIPSSFLQRLFAAASKGSGIGFDPNKDIALDDQGIWIWSSTKQQMHEDIESFFFARREEGFRFRHLSHYWRRVRYLRRFLYLKRIVFRKQVAGIIQSLSRNPQSSVKRFIDRRF
jgi:hypothetical protein